MNRDALLLKFALFKSGVNFIIAFLVIVKDRYREISLLIPVV
jgi:hypothetical protein